jgi:DNA-binding transcriptional ArsR family regulator
VSDSLRLEIVTSLTLKPATAAELAEELGEPPNRVRYQLGLLRKAGIAELKEVRPRRGVAERVYFVRRSFISVEEGVDLPPEKLEKGIMELLQAVLRDALKALRAGLFHRRDDFVATRVPLRLDARGWKEAVRLHQETLERTLRLQEEAAGRLEAGNETPITAFSALLLYEASEREKD